MALVDICIFQVHSVFGSMTDGRVSNLEKDLKLPQKYNEVNLIQREDVRVHVQNYYVPTNKLEAIIGEGHCWASLQNMLACGDLGNIMPFHDTSNIPTIIKQLARSVFRVFEYDTLSIYGIEIEHMKYVEQRKTKTDNSYLLLKAAGNSTMPSLARVQGIYRIIIPDEYNEVQNLTLDERILLLVKEYTLDDLDPDLKECGLQDVLLHSTETSAVERLIDVSCIYEQAFLSPDMRTIHGSLDEIAIFKSYLVHNKGSLRNVDLSHLSKKMPI